MRTAKHIGVTPVNQQSWLITTNTADNVSKPATTRNTPVTICNIYQFRLHTEWPLFDRPPFGLHLLALRVHK